MRAIASSVSNCGCLVSSLGVKLKVNLVLSPLTRVQGAAGVQQLGILTLSMVTPVEPACM